MEIFQNEHEVITIGNLTIENRLGKVIISGDVEIDGIQGRAQAQALYDFADALCQAFGQDTAKAQADLPNETVENPFA